MRVADWEGEANDSALTIEEKKAARAGLDLPEDVDKMIRAELRIQNEAAKDWRAGLVDIRSEDGHLFLRLTDEQARHLERRRRGRMLGNGRAQHGHG